MFCTKCGVSLGDSANYCSQCGAPTGPPAFNPNYRRLSRPLTDRKIAGVASGIARYFGVDPVVIRILFVALAILPPVPAIIPYIVCWILMPNDEPARVPPPAEAVPTSV